MLDQTRNIMIVENLIYYFHILFPPRLRFPIQILSFWKFLAVCTINLLWNIKSYKLHFVTWSNDAHGADVRYFLMSEKWENLPNDILLLIT